MTFITTDYSKNKKANNEFTPLPEGDYEMVIKSVYEDATPNGAEYINFSLQVRNDLDGINELQKKYHNRVVFMKHWKKKGEREYKTDKLNDILEASGYPEGQDLTLEQFTQFITHKPFKVRVHLEFDNYTKKEENVVAPWDYSKTNFPEVNHQFKKNNNQAPVNDEIQIDNNQLPF